MPHGSAGLRGRGALQQPLRQHPGGNRGQHRGAKPFRPRFVPVGADQQQKYQRNHQQHAAGAQSASHRQHRQHDKNHIHRDRRGTHRLERSQHQRVDQVAQPHHAVGHEPLARRDEILWSDHIDRKHQQQAAQPDQPDGPAIHARCGCVRTVPPTAAARLPRSRRCGFASAHANRSPRWRRDPAGCRACRPAPAASR